MTLKTNSKKAIQNVRAYILDNFDPEYAENHNVDEKDFNAVAAAIYADFFRVIKNDYRYIRHNMSLQELFADWASGLPGILDTCYYYNRSALKDVQNILEQSDAEAARFTESQAEELLTSLIFREIKKVVAA